MQETKFTMKQESKFEQKHTWLYALFKSRTLEKVNIWSKYTPLQLVIIDNDIN